MSKKIENILINLNTKLRLNMESIYNINEKYFDENIEEFEFLLDILSHATRSKIMMNNIFSFYKNGNHMHIVYGYEFGLKDKKKKELRSVANILSYEVLREAKDKKYDDKRIEVIRRAFVSYKFHTLERIPFDFLSESKEHAKLINELLENKILIEDDELIDYEFDELGNTTGYESCFDYFEGSAFNKKYGTMKYNVETEKIKEMNFYIVKKDSVKKEKIDLKKLPDKFKLDVCGGIPGPDVKDFLWKPENFGDGEFLEVTLKKPWSGQDEFVLINTNIKEVLKENFKENSKKLKFSQEEER